MVICGGNGCGKSAILHAIMTAKEVAGSYGGFEIDSSCISADSVCAKITLSLEFSPAEIAYAKRQFGNACRESDEFEVTINPKGRAVRDGVSEATRSLLRHYQSLDNSIGFFDYIDAHRQIRKNHMTTLDYSLVSDEKTKSSLAIRGTEKFEGLKAYLAALAFQDFQYFQESGQNRDSLAPIREFFDSFFAPMRFLGVRAEQASHFRFIVDTPRGKIDLDELSSGEKEVLSMFVRFHQLKPCGSIILFDEADAHLHPELERRYLSVLKDISRGNQLWVTTHSPEMMIAAGTESLFTLLKTAAPGENQFCRVTTSSDRHNALTELMGTRGIVSFNQRIVFIEGTESSLDREVYERLYPANVNHISFVPAGGSATVTKTAEYVNDLLSSSIEFQHFYSIVDGDINRTPANEAAERRIFRLPVYHVENFLLDPVLILAALSDIKLSKVQYSSEREIEDELIQIVLSESHLNAYAGALLDAELSKVARAAHDAVYRSSTVTPKEIPTYADMRHEAAVQMRAAVAAGTWPQKCKGREVLKGFSTTNSVPYELLRNLIVSKMRSPPPALDLILQRILAPTQTTRSQSLMDELATQVIVSQM